MVAPSLPAPAITLPARSSTPVSQESAEDLEMSSNQMSNQSILSLFSQSISSDEESDPLIQEPVTVVGDRCWWCPEVVLVVPEETPVAAKSKLQRWQAHHAALEPFVRSHRTLYDTLRQRWPQLFQPGSSLFRNLNDISSVIFTTLFPHLNPSNPGRMVKLRFMVDHLVFRIVYGTNLQELRGPKEPARLPPSPPPAPTLAEEVERHTQRTWEIEVTSSSSSKSGAAAPPASKRIRIESSSAGSVLGRDAGNGNGQNGIDVSTITIELSDSEDSPSVVLPVRKKRNYRIRLT